MHPHLEVCSKTARAAPMGLSVRRLAANLRHEPAVAEVAREFRSTLLARVLVGMPVVFDIFDCDIEKKPLVGPNDIALRIVQNVREEYR